MAVVLAAALGLTACGGGERQDVNEPSGNFPVQVTKSSFPTRQHLAADERPRARDQEHRRPDDPEPRGDDLHRRHQGRRTATGSGQGSFNIRLDDPSLADPNRPVWILENGYPKLLTAGVTTKNLNSAPSAGADAAQTNTFQFGAVNPGESKTAVWRVTPVHAGTYTVHYQVAAGL